MGRLSRRQMLHWPITVLMMMMGPWLVIKVRWLHKEEFDEIFLCGFIADLLIAVVAMLIKDNGSKG